MNIISKGALWLAVFTREFLVGDAGATARASVDLGNAAALAGECYPEVFDMPIPPGIDPDAHDTGFVAQ